MLDEQSLWKNLAENECDRDRCDNRRYGQKKYSENQRQYLERSVTLLEGSNQKPVVLLKNREKSSFPLHVSRVAGVSNGGERSYSA